MQHGDAGGTVKSSVYSQLSSHTYCVKLLAREPSQRIPKITHPVSLHATVIITDASVKNITPGRMSGKTVELSCFSQLLLICGAAGILSCDLNYILIQPNTAAMEVSRRSVDNNGSA